MREKIKDLAHFHYWENLEDNFHTPWYCMKCLLNELFPSFSLRVLSFIDFSEMS